jgi:hypothetical protein
MSTDLETRVHKVEWTIERHDENIRELYDSSEELRKSLTGIHQTLVQIKYFALGFACLYMADQFGLSSIFKLLG